MRGLARRRTIAGVSAIDQGRPPHDEALPQLAQLLDGEAVRPLLERSFGEPGSLGAVRVAYVRYRPRKRVLVAYEVEHGDERLRPVAQAAPGDSLRRRAERPASRALASLAAARCRARTPLAYDDALDALVEWPPLDLALPAIAEHSQRLRDALRDGGVELADDDLPHLVKHNHAHRAVFELRDAYAKAYRNDAALQRSLAALRAAEALRGAHGAPAARCRSCASRCSRSSGRAPRERGARGRTSRGAARRLHAAAPDGLDEVGDAGRPAAPNGDSTDLLSTSRPRCAPRGAAVSGSRPACPATSWYRRTAASTSASCSTTATSSP